MCADHLRVSVRRSPGLTAEELLEQVLGAAGFWDVLEHVRASHDVPTSALRIAIKPDVDAFGLDIACVTDPALVLYLSILLGRRGYRMISVIDGRNAGDAWLLNRDPLLLPDLLGYDFSGQPYTVVGGADTPTAAGAWADADFRINFAKNRTHETQLYALCLHNLLGIAPGGTATADAGDRCLDVLRNAPAHFNLIDAFVSCHGPAGERFPVEFKTCTMIGSADARLADLAGSLRMGLDPYASPLAGKCLRVLGLPPAYDIDGDLEPYAMWQNVHPLVADSARGRDEADTLGAVAAGWFQRVDREQFPFRDYYNDRANSFIAPMMGRLGEDPRTQLLVVLLNYAIAGVGKFVRAQQTMFAKRNLLRQARALETDLATFADEDYLRLRDHLEQSERLLGQAPETADAMRLRRIDGAMLFAGAHELPVDYDDFTARVRIEHSIQYMNDYLGGSLVTVAEDELGRPHMQAERNLYLQQPNWMVLLGGDIIDVEKLELVCFEADRQSIYWRTVASPNASAECDDGRVSFVRGAEGCTRVEIFTRQKFALPLFFQAARIDLFPGVRDPIVERAYRNFFRRTIANMQACFEGRDYRVGREPSAVESLAEQSPGDLGRYFATALATVSELLRHRDDVAGVGDWFAARSWVSSERATPVEDADGFRHFGPTPRGSRYDRTDGDIGDYLRQWEAAVADSPGFFSGLAAAMQRDLEAFADRHTEDAPP